MWCFPSTGFLSLHAQWCNPEGTMAVVDDLYPGRTFLGDSSHGLSWVGHTGKQRNREKPAVTLLSLPICLGSHCWEIHPTPWFAGESFNSSQPCLCSDLHVGRIGLAQPKTAEVYQHCSCSHWDPQCFLLSPLHFFSGFLNTPFYLAALGEKQWGENGWETMKCVKICVGEKEPF